MNFKKKTIKKTGISTDSVIPKDSVIPALSGNPESKREGKSLPSRLLKTGSQSNKSWTFKHTQRKG